MAIFNKDRGNRPILTRRNVPDESGGAYPFVIERKLKGYKTMAIAFIVATAVLLLVTRSFISAALGLLLAALMFLLYFMEKKRVDQRGYEMWHFVVMEYTYLTRMNKKPTGFYAEAIDGPYKGKICHIALASQTVTPPLEQEIELCVAGDTVASPVRDIFYVPQYYGMTIISENTEADEA